MDPVQKIHSLLVLAFWEVNNQHIVVIPLLFSFLPPLGSVRLPLGRLSHAEERRGQSGSRFNPGLSSQSSQRQFPQKLSCHQLPSINSAWNVASNLRFRILGVYF